MAGLDPAIYVFCSAPKCLKPRNVKDRNILHFLLITHCLGLYQSKIESH